MKSLTTDMMENGLTSVPQYEQAFSPLGTTFLHPRHGTLSMVFELTGEILLRAAHRARKNRRAGRCKLLQPFSTAQTSTKYFAVRAVKRAFLTPKTGKNTAADDMAEVHNTLCVSLKSARLASYGDERCFMMSPLTSSARKQTTSNTIRRGGKGLRMKLFIQSRNLVMVTRFSGFRNWLRIAVPQRPTIAQSSTSQMALSRAQSYRAGNMIVNNPTTSIISGLMNGRPHLGQDRASVETSVEQSGHLISAMVVNASMHR